MILKFLLLYPQPFPGTSDSYIQLPVWHLFPWWFEEVKVEEIWGKKGRFETDDSRSNQLTEAWENG